MFAMIYAHELIYMESNIPLTIINTISVVISGLDKSHLPPKVDVTCDNTVDEKATIDGKKSLSPDAGEDEIVQYLFDPSSYKRYDRHIILRTKYGYFVKFIFFNFSYDCTSNWS